MSPDLQDVFIEDLRDLHGTEQEQLKFLQVMAEAAAEPALEQALRQHLEATRAQVDRLKRIFQSLGEDPGGEAPRAVEGMIADAEEKSGRDADNEVIDLALIGAGRKMEHFEMACYLSARAMAHAMGLDEAVRLLDETLREEEAADRKLAQIAEPLLKRAAEAEDEIEAEEAEEEEEEEEGGKHFTA